MRQRRPAEELYDVRADPHQIDDLAAVPAHRPALQRLRAAVADWMTRIGDQGLINEAEMIQRMWPGGVQPETAQPYIVPRRATADVSRPAAIAAPEPVEVVIYVPTQGASIGYTTEDGPAQVAALHRPDPRPRADDAPRQGDPLRLQGKRGNPRGVHALSYNKSPFLSLPARTGRQPHQSGWTGIPAANLGSRRCFSTTIGGH